MFADVSAQEIAVITGPTYTLDASTTELTCTYSTRDPADSVTRLAWKFGQAFSTALDIGYYLNDSFNNSALTYTIGNGYGPPGHVISIDNIVTGTGSSVLTISNVTLDDDQGKYWCEVLVLGDYGSFSDANGHDISVNGM